MTVSRRWLLPDPPTPQARESLTAFPRTLQQLLFNRGIETAQAADDFLNPAALVEGDPYDIPDMDAAVHRIQAARFAGETIGIYGDFDSDGVTGTTLLLESFRNLGIPVVPYIPSRAEGHGMNGAALQSLRQQDCTLVITVDCGVSGINGDAPPPRDMDIIVTDHHLPGEQLPDVTAVVNPMRSDSRYPYPRLAGVGVAYKLAQALHAEQDTELPDSLLELVALGTVADVAPLIDENRSLVTEGLARMRTTQRPGIRILASITRRTLSRLTSEDIAFQLAPRINAAGRLTHANDALRLLCTHDDDEARTLAVQLDELNQRRREMTEAAYQSIRETMSTQDEDAPVIVAGAPGMPTGILGLVAARLVEEFYCPSFVYSIDDDGMIRGSARSITEFDVDGALKASADLLTQFGGHHRAAGFTARESDLPSFRERLHGLAVEALAGVERRPILAIDAEGAPSRIATDLAPFLSRMEPHGEGNRKPIFLSRGLAVVSARAVGSGGHLRMTVAEPETGRQWGAIAFRQGEKRGAAHGLIDVAYQFQENDWQSGDGREPTLELNVQDFRPAEAG